MKKEGACAHSNDTFTFFEFRNLHAVCLRGVCVRCLAVFIYNDTKNNDNDNNNNNSSKQNGQKVQELMMGETMCAHIFAFTFSPRVLSYLPLL